MKNSYLIVGIGSLALTGLAAPQAKTIPLQSLKHGLGPAFFPFLLLSILALLGITALVVGSITHFPKEAAGKSEERHLATVLLGFGLLIAYGFLFARVGFFMSTVVFMALAMALLKTRWWVAVVFSVMLTSCIYILFIWLLKVPLP